MTTEELENSLREAAEVRLAAIDDSAVHAAADRACAGRAPQHGENRPDRPAPAKGGIAVLNPFRYGAKGVAIFAAAVLIVIGAAVGITLWIINSDSHTAYDMITLLEDTEINMDGVTGFGALRTETGASSVSASVTSSASLSSPAGDDKEYSTTLVTFDENGDIEEVVFRYTDGSGEVTQDELGYLHYVYTLGDYTFVEYGVENLWQGDLSGEMLADTLTYGQRELRCDQDSQTFVIHNPTGKVYSLHSAGDAFTKQLYGSEATSLIVWAYDGGVSMDIGYHISSTNDGMDIASFKLDIAENGDLVLTDVMPNRNIRVYNMFTDAYGNTFVCNDELNDVTDGIMYYTGELRYYEGSDGLAYRVDDGRISVSGEDYSLSAPDITKDVVLHKSPSQMSNSEGLAFIKNGYLLFGDENDRDVCKLSADGTYERTGVALSAYGGLYSMSGEIFASVISPDDSVDMFCRLDLSEFDGTAESIAMTEIAEFSSVHTSGLMPDVILLTVQSLTSTEVYTLTVENGEVVRTLLDSSAYGGTMVSIQPLN